MTKHVPIVAKSLGGWTASEQASAPRRMMGCRSRMLEARSALRHDEGHEQDHACGLYGCTPIEQASASVGPMEAWLEENLLALGDNERAKAREIDATIAAQARQIAELKDEADRMAQGYLDEAKAAKRAEAKIAAYRAALQSIQSACYPRSEDIAAKCGDIARAALEEPQGE